ncbi:methyltransferase-like protein 22 [Rhinophrynus dorsalis]
MEAITFTKDTVLSDVHIHTQHKRHLMVRLNAVGQPVFQSQYKILWANDELLPTSDDRINNSDPEGRSENEDKPFNIQETKPNDLQKIGNLLDDDGDLEVPRRSHSPYEREEKCFSRNVVCPTILMLGHEQLSDTEEPVYSSHEIVKIEHTMATPLEDVGKQIWRGAFLLADYVLWQQDLFRGSTVLELGAGTGFTSIIMAMSAKTVYCTDVGDDLLEMCERNVTLNRCLTDPTGGEVKVKELDWLKNELCTDTESPYSWTEEEIADLYDHTSVILAADVFYDDDLTDALFKTLYRISHASRNPCTIYLSIEKRLNFTIRHMDITCDAYNHFRLCLNNFKHIRDGKLKWTAEIIMPTFPQFFSYERIDKLELWKISAVLLT